MITEKESKEIDLAEEIRLAARKHLATKTVKDAGFQYFLGILEGKKSNALSIIESSDDILAIRFHQGYRQYGKEVLAFIDSIVKENEKETL